MALLSSPAPASTMFHQSNAPTHTTLLSGTQLSQSASGPPRGLTNGQSTGRPLVNLENGRASLQDNNGPGNMLVNGHAAGVIASSEANNESFEPQNNSRARTENHQTFAHRPKVSMTRSKTNYESENTSPTRETSVEEHGELRHGWEDEYNSSEFLGHLNSVLFLMPSATPPDFGWLTLSVDFLHVLHR